MIFFGNADYIIYIPFSPGCRDVALGSKCKLLKIFNVNVCYNRRDWGIHGCFLELFVKDLLE